MTTPKRCYVSLQLHPSDRKDTTPAMKHLNLLLIPTLLSLHPEAYPQSNPNSYQSISPYKFHLTFKPPPRRVSNHEPPQTPAQDRSTFFDNIIATPATIVPKLFGDKPFWVPHAYFNLCPFVRGPDIDPVWSAGCAQLPYNEMPNFSPNPQDVGLRLQALQAQQEQAQKEAEQQPSWWEQFRPPGPVDFGMADMYGVQQQEMYSYGPGEAETANARGSTNRGRGYPGNWGAGASGFWQFWG